MSLVERSDYLKSLSSADYDYLFEDPFAWDMLLRPEQLRPVNEVDWRFFLFLTGRGFGKSAALTNWLAYRIAHALPGEVGAIIAQNIPSAESVLLHDKDHGLFTAHQADLPKMDRPNQRDSIYHFENGVKLYVFSAEAPDNIRGKNISFCGVDELLFYPDPQYTLEACIEHAIRKSSAPQVCIATTPNHKKHAAFTRKLLQKPGLLVQTGSTLDNTRGLSQVTLDAKRKDNYSRSEREEIFGEILSEGGSVFNIAHIQRVNINASERPAFIESLDRIVVSADPATSENGTTGIIVVGIKKVFAQDTGKPKLQAYVLEDASTVGIPHIWGNAVVTAYHKYQADSVVAESNQGGLMVSEIIKQIDSRITVKLVKASRGKVARAEPVSNLYSDGRVFHMGTFEALEDQMTEFDPLNITKRNSPDRVDALVWALTELMLSSPGVVKSLPYEISSWY